MLDALYSSVKIIPPGGSLRAVLGVENWIRITEYIDTILAAVLYFLYLAPLYKHTLCRGGIKVVQKDIHRQPKNA